MTQWQVHWLEAEADLSAWRNLILSEIEAARIAVTAMMPPPRLDVLVQPSKFVIPEIGLTGRAMRPSLFSISVDPNNVHFATSLAGGALPRTVAHEVHHCMRMGSGAWGKTLGHALVNEGLAGHFAQRLCSSAPEVWERAIDAETLRVLTPTREELHATRYDRAAWFFGAGGQRPRWFGYTLGYEIVGRWLTGAGEIDAATWLNVSAKTVLEAGVTALPS